MQQALTDSLSVTTPQQQAQDAIKDVVNSYLDAEDTTALVRLVFSAAASAAAAKDPKPAGPEVDLQGSSSDVEEDLQAPHAAELEPAVVVGQLLSSVAEEQQALIEAICRSNAEEMARALGGLGLMEEGSSSLHEQVMSHNTELQATGGSFAACLGELQQLKRTQAAVSASKQAVKLAVGLLQKCVKASQLAAERQLHAAVRLLLTVQAQLSSCSAPEADLAPAEGGSPTNANGSDGLAHGKQSIQLGRLQPYLAASLQRLLQGIEQAAVADFNDWLVNVRAHAVTTGLHAMTAAARQRASEHAAACDCRRVHAQVLLPSSSVTAPLASSAPQDAFELAIHPAAAHLLAHAPAAAPASVLEGIDMTLLHRCIHVHASLGRIAAFQEYYHRNRQLQLASELQVPPDFAAAPQAWVARLTGFFLVEDCVQRTATALPASAQAFTGWESAVARIKAAADSALAAAASPAAALLLKDFLLLACTALRQCDYHVGPLQEHLMKAAPIHHKLLCIAAAPQVAAAVAADTGSPMQITSAAALAQLSGAMGLPLSLTGAPSPSDAGPVRLPISAPYSGLVPKLLGYAYRFVDATYAWARGLAGGRDVLSTVRSQRDAFLAHVLVPAVHQAVDAVPAGATADEAVVMAMRRVTNVWCLTRGLHCLDAYTSFCCRGYPAAAASEAVRQSMQQPPDPAADSRRHHRTDSSGGGNVGAMAAQAWHSLQAAAESVVVRLVAKGAGDIVDRARALPWLPDQPPRNAAAHSAYIAELLAYLKEVFSRAAAAMPPEVVSNMAAAAFRFVGDALIALLCHEAVPAFNLYAIFRLHDDVAALAQLADSLPAPHLAEGLAEIAQLCTVLVTGHVEDVAQPQKRAARCPALQPKHLVVILPKYREIGDKASYTGSHTMGRSKQPESFVKKRTIDSVVKQLRSDMKDEDRSRRTSASKTAAPAADRSSQNS